MSFNYTHDRVQSTPRKFIYKVRFYMGEIAALITSFCWAFSSLFFSTASQKAGSIHVNRVRLAFAVVLFILSHWISQGELLPWQAGFDRWLWLGLSGIVGLVLGDFFLFQAYITIGVRLGTLIMSGVPVISTLAAWIMLGERLSAVKIGGILLTVFGIALVVLERKNGNGQPHDRRAYLVGILFGLGGAIGQAGGLILAKRGLYGDFPSISAVVIRMSVAALTIWLLALFTGQARTTVRQIAQDRSALRLIAFGSLVGPFAGVWLSMVAIQYAYVGIASTLMALTPVILLPIMKWGYKEDISKRAVFGTLLSIAGVAALFLAV